MDLGKLRCLAEVRLNDQDLGVLWCPPWRVDVTDTLKPTGNVLEIDVVNVWANRIVGDLSLPEEERLTWTSLTDTISALKPDQSLVPSGLYGPVALCVTICVPPLAGIGAAAVDKPLIAYWTFDEDFGHRCADVSGNGADAAPQGGTGGLARTEGLFGNAMRFSGGHFLRTPGKPAFGELEQIALSAWVMPTEFAACNEIFRKEDGDARVLFSFQEEGSILSLGLNIGGYVECDAKIEPDQLLDGRWHHCAGTFDGHDDAACTSTESRLAQWRAGQRHGRRWRARAASVPWSVANAFRALSTISASTDRP